MRSVVNSLVKTLATDLAQYNIRIIRINNLIPGSINTDLIKALNNLVFSLYRVTKDQGGK